jgi:hypothetical protein
MGGLFKAPKVVGAPAEAAAPAPAPAETAETAAAASRAEARARARRGLAGTIATSARGVLAPLPDFATRKTLLGE